MKNRNSSKQNIYEMWARLQNLLESGEACMEHVRTPDFTEPPVEAILASHAAPPYAVAQYFLSTCPQPNIEVMSILPDDLYISC